MKYFLVISVILFFNLTQNYSQLKEGNHLAGVTLGFSSKSANVIFGGNYEYELPPAGIGIFGIGAMTRFWTYSEDILNKTVNLKYSNITLGGQVNYNFNQIASGKFVPFVGLVVGYNNVSTKYTAYDNVSIIGYDQTYKSGLFMWGQGGFRYFFTKKAAGVLRLGLGNFDLSTIELGFDYKF